MNHHSGRPGDELSEEELWHRANVDRARRSGQRLYVERDVNPTLAAVLLQQNPENRNYKPTKIHAYAEAMQREEWVINGEVIKIAHDGALNDGQNRLQAIIEANITVPLGFIYGLSRESRMTLDQGLNRTLADVLTMTGLTSTSQLGGMAKFVWEYLQHGLIGVPKRYAPTREQVRLFIGDNEDLLDSLEEISASGARSMGAGRQVVAFAYHVMRTSLPSTDPEDIKAFINQLVNGNDLKMGNPVLLARERIGRDRTTLTPNEKAMAIFRAWNALRRDEHPTNFQLNRAAPLPQLEE